MNQHEPGRSLSPYPVRGNLQYPGLPGSMPPGGYGYQPFEEETGFDPFLIIVYLLKYRWLIAVCLAVSLFLGIFAYLVQVPTYRATTMVEITPQGARVLEDLQSVTTNNDLRTYETARLKFESLELAKRVSFELNLPNDTVFLAAIPSFSLQNLFDRAFGTQPLADLNELTLEERNQLAIEKIDENTSASLVRNTSIIRVAFEHPDPEKAQLVANQIAKSYIDLNVDRKLETSNIARDFIQQQVIEAKDQLERSEKALVDYAREQSITITGESASLTAAKISQLNTSLSEAINERLSIERLVRQIEAGQAETLPAVFESVSIQKQREVLTELRATYEQKLATLKPGFPEMVRLRRQINSINSQIALEVGAIAKSTQIQYEQAQEKEVALKAELEKLEEEDSAFQQKNIQYTILKREADSDRAQYESLITKLNEVGVGSNLRVSNANIVELAPIPLDPVSPRLLLNLAVFAALGMALCAAAIYVLELLNNVFVVPDHIEEYLKIPVLGILPKMEDGQFAEEIEEPTSGISEAFRSLRTSLQFSGTDLNVTSLAVTSSEPAEGKSTTSLQLAKDFAKLGRNVLLIDADLRKPNLHRLLKTDNSLGLSNLLSNVVPSGSISSIFKKIEKDNITFVSSGTIPPNPADLLVSPRMGLILHACKKQFDMIIIDCPPVIGLSDAPIITRQIESTLLVVHANRTTRKSAQNALQRISNAGANVVGAALNKFETNRLDYSYSYRYMNYNYYTYSAEGAPGGLLAGHNGKKTRHADTSGTMGSIRNFIDRLQRRIG